MVLNFANPGELTESHQLPSSKADEMAVFRGNISSVRQRAIPL